MQTSCSPNNSSVLTYSDFVIMAVAFFALPFIYSYYWQTTNNGTFATITITDHKTQYVSLNKNQIFNVEGQLGHSTLQVKQGRIRFVDSPCKAKYCIHSGWLQKQTAIAVCVPNGISIVVSNKESQFDAINF